MANATIADDNPGSSPKQSSNATPNKSTSSGRASQARSQGAASTRNQALEPKAEKLPSRLKPGKSTGSSTRTSNRSPGRHSAGRRSGTTCTRRCARTFRRSNTNPDPDHAPRGQDRGRPHEREALLDRGPEPPLVDVPETRPGATSGSAPRIAVKLTEFFLAVSGHDPGNVPRSDRGPDRRAVMCSGYRPEVCQSPCRPGGPPSRPRTGQPILGSVGRRMRTRSW